MKTYLVCFALALTGSAFAQLPELPKLPLVDPPVAPVPEAGTTWILLACGLVAIAGLRRWVTRRRR